MTKTKADLVEYVATSTGFTKRDTAVIVDAFLNVLCKALEDNHRVEIRGLGVFKNKQRKPRVARNPKTGSPVHVPSRLVPTFKPSRLLKARVV
jgi:nucleoid DNA-binding protein